MRSTTNAPGQVRLRARREQLNREQLNDSERRGNNLKTFAPKMAQAKALTGVFAPSWLDSGYTSRTGSRPSTSSLRPTANSPGQVMRPTTNTLSRFYYSLLPSERTSMKLERILAETHYQRAWPLFFYYPKKGP